MQSAALFQGQPRGALFSYSLFFFFHFLARSRIFIRARLGEDFSFSVAGKYTQLKTINHLDYIHASLELYFWTQVKYDKCEFHNFL